MDQEQPDDVGEDVRVGERAAPGPVLAAQPSTIKPATVPQSEAGDAALEPAVRPEPVRQPDEVSLEEAHLVKMAAASPNAGEQPPSVPITPHTELDPSITALAPELASQLDGRADEVIVDAAAVESPAAQPARTELQLSELLDSSNPVTAAYSPDPPDDAVVADPPEIRMQTFPALAVSVADARRFAVEALADIPAEVLDDIRLMVSELASNAIEHARSGFQLTIRRSRQMIRVEVLDSGAGTPAMRATGPDALKGRGLQVVNTVSTQWGVEHASDSAKTVWFTRELAAPAGPLPAA